jgi:hypothetical protein
MPKGIEPSPAIVTTLDVGVPCVAPVADEIDTANFLMPTHGVALLIGMVKVFARVSPFAQLSVPIERPAFGGIVLPGDGGLGDRIGVLQSYERYRCLSRRLAALNL